MQPNNIDDACHLVAFGTGAHNPRCLSSLGVFSLCGPWVTIWFPASHQAQPYRKLYVGARRFDAEMGCTLTSLVGRGAGGGRTVARVDSPGRSRRGLVGRMGVKRPKKGLETAILGGICYVAHNGQLLFKIGLCLESRSTRVPRGIDVT